MCKYCERKSVLHKGWCIYDTYADNQEEIATGDYTTLYIAVDNDGRICMRACGDDYTDNYYPKFCPECGAKLINNCE